MTNKRVVLTTTGTAEEARKIAQHLVEHQLAACVNIVPHIESIYRWQGKMETSAEWLLLIKTTDKKFTAIGEAIGRLHSYDLPECIALVIEDGNAPYLQWIAESTN
jgi:periplasmic divalent cation tolerance protein